LKKTYIEIFNRKKHDLENYIGDRLVSITMFSMSHDAADVLDRIVGERRRIMVEVDRAFGFKKETPS
jgi:hypothetical protein